MAPKRRKEVEDADEEAPASKSSRENPDISRKAKFKAHLTALNSQFAEWVNKQVVSCPSELWASGVKEYVAYVDKLLGDFKDVVDAEKGGRALAGLGGSAGWGTSNAGSGLFGSGTSNGTDGAGGSGGGGGGAFSFGGNASNASGFGSGAATMFGSSATEAFNNQNGPFGAARSTDAANGDANNATERITATASGNANKGTASGAFNFGGPSSAATTTATTSSLFGSSTPAFGSTPTPAFGTSTVGSGLFGSTGAAGGLTGSTGAPAQEPTTSATASTTSTTTSIAGSTFAFGGSGSSAGPAATPSDFWNKPFGFGGAAAAAGGAKDIEGAKEGGAAAPVDGKEGGADGKGGDAPVGGGLFNFGKASAMPVPSFGPTSGGFANFNFSAPGGTVPAATAAPADEEGEEEGPQKYESAIETSEEAGAIHYKSKTKFYKMKSGIWDVMGVGQLMVRTRKEDPTKPFITFTTEAGRVLYCANVLKSMKLIVNEPKSTVAWSAPWSSEPGAPPTSVSIMTQLPKAQAPKFVEAVQKLQESMSA